MPWKHIFSSINEARIDADIHVMLKESHDVVELLLKQNSKADLVFSGLARGTSNLEERVQTLEHVAKHLKAVAFVQNNGMAGEIPTIFNK